MVSTGWINTSLVASKMEILLQNSWHLTQISLLPMLLLILGLSLFCFFFHLFFFPAILFLNFTQYFAHYLAIFLLIKGFPCVSPAFEHA